MSVRPVRKLRSTFFVNQGVRRSSQSVFYAGTVFFLLKVEGYVRADTDETEPGVQPCSHSRRATAPRVA